MSANAEAEHMPTLPDRNPRVSMILIIAAIGFFIIAMAQVALLAWRLIDGWLGPF